MIFHGMLNDVKKKRVLVVSSCQMRGDTTGLTGMFLSHFNDLRKGECEIELFNIGFWTQNRDPQQYAVDKYWKLQTYKVEPIVRKIPKIRSSYAKLVSIGTFRMIVKSQKYDLVILFQVPVFAYKLISISHEYGTKVAMFPWGSDILRVTRRDSNCLMKAFEKTDYVVGNNNSNTIIASKKTYKVPENKIRLMRNYCRGAMDILKVKGKNSRQQMMQDLNIPYSPYNIVCGYNGSEAQQHKAIINAVIENKSCLPDNYQLIFPVTYQRNESYINDLKNKCFINNINACFIEKFISDEQMAYLHLITDLFIQIQPTDCGNAFMIESLVAKNRIVTGSWLNYVQFEQFGVPYHLIDRLDELSFTLHNIFVNKIEPPIIPQELIELYTCSEGYNYSFFWRDILKEI